MSSKIALDSSHRKPWSLATRLTLWYALSSFVVIATSMAFLYWTLIEKLEAEDDQFMAEKIELVRLLLKERKNGPEILQPDNTTNGTVSVYIRVVDSSRRTKMVTKGMDELLPSFLFPHSQKSGPVRGREQWLPNGKCFRIASFTSPSSNQDTPEYLIQIALDRTQEEELLLNYRWNLLGVLLVSLTLSTYLGYRIARHGIRPVQAIAATASRIRSSTLYERIETVSLPGELLTLAFTFNAMLDRLELSFERLRQFSSDIAHELRTPVNNIRGEIEVALGKPRTSGEYEEVLGSSLEECGRLATLIDSMLFLARAENPRTLIEKEPLSVIRELQTVCDFYEVAANEADVDLNIQGSEEIIANLNRSLFQRALSNLVANALAHSSPGGSIRLRVERRDGIQITVSDTGSGISPEHLSHVFERFYRANHSRTAPGGVGLGLAIVRSILELHGGTVSISSEPEKGTHVTLKLPAIDSPAPAT